MPIAAPSMSQSRWTAIGIWIGAGLFIIALAGSALVVPPLRPLHFFQALIYVAIIWLARRQSAWVLGAAVTIAVAWNVLQLFITHNFQSGAVAFWSWLETGQPRRVDTMMVTVATIAHFVLIVSCLAAFRPHASGKEWAKFLGGGVIVLAYFAVIVATLLPR